MSAFIVFAFASQLALVAFFATLGRRPDLSTIAGRVVYALGVVAAALAIVLAIDGQPWYLVVALGLYAAWSALGTWIDIVHPIGWRVPPRWSIFIPYVALLTAAQIGHVGPALVRRPAALDRVRDPVRDPHDAQHLVARRRGPDRASPDLTYGIGAVETSVLHMYGSAAGDSALNTARNTAPETVFEPRLPDSVTLMSRPDTPTFERSRPASAPTFVRGSAPKIADSCSSV